MSDSYSDLPIAIVGASRGVGATLARLLAAKGRPLALASRSGKAPENLEGANTAATFALEATDWSEVDAFFGEAEAKLGPLYGTALCVGSILLKPAHLTSEREFRKAIDLNLGAAFAVVRSAAKRLRRRGGSIALVSSAAARRGLSNHEAIAAAKAGVAGLVRSAAATYARNGIRVNCVSPGLVDTDMAATITGNPAALKASKALHPLGRIGRPDDVARALDWLLDPLQSWVTGQDIAVDGGLSALGASG